MVAIFVILSGNVVKSILYDYHSLSGMTPVGVAISEAEYHQNPVFCSVFLMSANNYCATLKTYKYMNNYVFGDFRSTGVEFSEIPEVL